MTESERIAKLEGPSHPVHVVFDTASENEISDAFAVSYAILSAKTGQLCLDAIYTAKQKQKEFVNLCSLVGSASHFPVYEGIYNRLINEKAADSPAVGDLISRALSHTKEDPLYIITSGSTVNVASALLISPEIAEHIVIIALVEKALPFSTPADYKIEQDPTSFNILSASGIPMILFPIKGVATHMVTTSYEVNAHLLGKNKLADKLCSMFCQYDNPSIQEDYAFSRCLPALAPLFFLINPSAFLSSLTSAPILSEDLKWTRDKNRMMIRIIDYFERDPIFADVFDKLGHKEDLT